MKNRTGVEDERGTSPVIGNILVVAIVVILGAVLLTLSLTITDSTTERAPEITWETEEEPREFVTGRDGDASVQFTHVAGDVVPNPNERIIIKYDGAATFSTASDDHEATDLENGIIREVNVTLDGKLKAGEKINVTLSCCRESMRIANRDDIRDVDDAANGDTIYIVWVGDDPSETYVLAEHTLIEQDE